jgi:hypothetical protein
MAKYAREELEFNTAATLKEVKSAYSVGLTGVFERKFTEMGGCRCRHSEARAVAAHARGRRGARSKSSPERRRWRCTSSTTSPAGRGRDLPPVLHRK